MKRSEMLKLIHGLLEPYMFEYGHGESLSKVILKGIENAGMLPPAVKSTEYYKDWESGSTYSCPKEEYIWEPEDCKPNCCKGNCHE